MWRSPTTSTNWNKISINGCEVIDDCHLAQSSNNLATLTWPIFFPSLRSLPRNMAYIVICRSGHTHLESDKLSDKNGYPSHFLSDIWSDNMQKKKHVYGISVIWQKPLCHPIGDTKNMKNISFHNIICIWIWSVCHTLHIIRSDSLSERKSVSSVWPGRKAYLHTRSTSGGIPSGLLDSYGCAMKKYSHYTQKGTDPHP